MKLLSPWFEQHFKQQNLTALIFGKIKFSNRYKNCDKNTKNVFVSLDSTDFRINEPYPFNTKWFSHKFKAVELRCEIGLCIRSSHIVWVSGGFLPGDFSDVKIVHNGILNWIEPKERIVVDDGYAES